MKRVIKFFVWFVAVTSAIRAVGAAAARRYEGGRTAADADEVRLAAIWNGRNFRSRAAALRSLKARALLGGINIDLTGAELHPEGATVEVEAHLGGVNIEVRGDWRIEVRNELRAGGVSLDVPETAAEDAPLLEIAVTGTAAGVNVEAAG